MANSHQQASASAAHVVEVYMTCCFEALQHQERQQNRHAAKIVGMCFLVTAKNKRMKECSTGMCCLIATKTPSAVALPAVVPHHKQQQAGAPAQTS
jgi:hypothetical protein